MARGLDLDEMTLNELTALLTDIEAAIPERKTADINALRQQLASIASDAGYTLDEVIGKGRMGKSLSRPAVPVKYRNPDNPSETWTGRGRKAGWLTERLKKRGAKLEDFAV